MTEEEYRTAWIETEYIVAGWWIEKPLEQEIEWQLNSSTRMLLNGLNSVL